MACTVSFTKNQPQAAWQGQTCKPFGGGKVKHFYKKTAKGTTVLSGDALAFCVGFQMK
ncbi:MAG: hypothetical protein PHG02_00370 [Oscillospiraceae bacterium]|nr:hypothetical protein [Oscillospiraceae bacterium]